jgi:hypothetical protein
MIGDMAKKGEKCLEGFGGEICVWQLVINLIVLGQESVTGAGDHDNESSGSIKAENSLILWKMFALEGGLFLVKFPKEKS